MLRTVRCRTVANTLSMGLVVRMCCQCSAGEVVEREQRFPVPGQAGDRVFGYLAWYLASKATALPASLRLAAIQI